MKNEEIEAPYELPDGWEWIQQRYSHTDDSVFPNRKDFVRLRCKLTEDSILLRKISGNSKGEN